MGSDFIDLTLRVLMPFGMWFLLGGYFVLNAQRERIFGYPPYDRYAEPLRYWLVQGVIALLAVSCAVRSTEVVAQRLGVFW